MSRNEKQAVCVGRGKAIRHSHSLGQWVHVSTGDIRGYVRSPDWMGAPVTRTHRALPKRTLDGRRPAP